MSNNLQFSTHSFCFQCCSLVSSVSRFPAVIFFLLEGHLQHVSCLHMLLQFLQFTGCRLGGRCTYSFSQLKRFCFAVFPHTLVPTGAALSVTSVLFAAGRVFCKQFYAFPVQYSFLRGCVVSVRVCVHVHTYTQSVMLFCMSVCVSLWIVSHSCQCCSFPSAVSDLSQTSWFSCPKSKPLNSLLLLCNMLTLTSNFLNLGLERPHISSAHMTQGSICFPLLGNTLLLASAQWLENCSPGFSVVSCGW